MGAFRGNGVEQGGMDMSALEGFEGPPPDPNRLRVEREEDTHYVRLAGEFDEARLESVGPGVSVLARLDDGRIVAAQQGRLLATAFHPELTGDDRFHQLFVNLAREGA